MRGRHSEPLCADSPLAMLRPPHKASPRCRSRADPLIHGRGRIRLRPRPAKDRWLRSDGVVHQAGQHGDYSVPQRYHVRMAMNLRLTEEETAALRRKAEEEGRSMQ